jgi:flagellar export protein FliJ
MSNKFRLGVVLRLREMEEETARIALGHALDDHQRAVQGVEAAQGRAGEEARWLSDLELAEAGQLQSAVVAVDSAQRAVAVAQEKLGRATNALFQARRALADATRQREVVERLRDRFLIAERRETERRDAMAMSEIASTQRTIRAAREHS